jgi:hypothetical protein
MEVNIMLKNVFVVVLFMMLNSTIFSQPSEYGCKIQAIPYVDFSYEPQKGFYENWITILGWRRDGKILVRQKSYNYFSDFDYIMDLVEDKIIWRQSEYESPERNFFDISRKNYLAEIANQYGIEPVVNKIGEFPYINNSNGKEYTITMRKEQDSNNNQKNISVYIYEITNRKSKYINKIVYDYYPWIVLDYDKKLEFWFAKSPFENRLAVIFVISVRQHEFDFDYFDLRIYGTHLDIGL